MLEQVYGELSLGRYTGHRGVVQLDDPSAEHHVGVEGSSQALGHLRRLDRGGNCRGQEGWRMEPVAVLVVHGWMLDIEYSPELRNNLVRKLAMRGRNARRLGYTVAEGRGHTATPRWSPHFRTRSVNAVCALEGLDGDVRVR